MKRLTALLTSPSLWQPPGSGGRASRSRSTLLSLLGLQRGRILELHGREALVKALENRLGDVHARVEEQEAGCVRQRRVMPCCLAISCETLMIVLPISCMACWNEKSRRSCLSRT